MPHDLPILNYAARFRQRRELPLWIQVLLFIFWMLLTNAFVLFLIVVTTYGVFVCVRS